MSLTNDGPDLHRLQQNAVIHLSSRSVSRAKVAAFCRCRLATINNLMSRPGLVLGSEKSRRLSRLASIHGYDALGASYLAPDKVPVPVPASAEIDGCIVAELRDVLEDAGEISRADREGSLEGVEQHCDEGIVALVAIKAEVQGRRRRMMERAGARRLDRSPIPWGIHSQDFSGDGGPDREPLAPRSPLPLAGCK